LACALADLYNGRIVRVANSLIFKEPVFNYSSDFPCVWYEIVLPVKYGSDMHVARDVLQRLVNGAVGEYAIYAQKAWGKEKVNAWWEGCGVNGNSADHQG
jgi:small-conductance mechanosensitive channel